MPFWKGCQQWVDCDYKPALKYLWLYFLLNKHSCPYHLHRTDNWGGNEKTTGLNAIGRHDVLVQTQEEAWFSIKELAAYNWDGSKAFGLLLRISPRCSRGSMCQTHSCDTQRCPGKPCWSKQGRVTSTVDLLRKKRGKRRVTSLACLKNLESWVKKVWNTVLGNLMLCW